MSPVVAYSVLGALAALTVTGVGQEADAATTTIEGTDVNWKFSDSKGNSYSWSMPVVTYENTVVKSRDLVRDKINLQLDDSTIRTINFDGFVRMDFTKVIGGVYDNSYDNSDFIWEVWHIVSQLTVYDEDLHEYSEGRYALETLTRGGGDCEDLVILVADMLMSSPHTRGWTFEYVYMDADNPTDPQTMNHVILAVNDGEYIHYIEATGSPSWNYFPDGVTGWWFEVVPHTDILNFTGADLAGMDLSRKDLAGAILVGADLKDADLTGANLGGADLTGADLTGASLGEAYMRGADLSWASLAGAYVRETDLGDSIMFGADLSYADLTRSYLRGADLGGSILVGAYLNGADLGDSIMFGADLSSADLARTYLRGADLSHADLTGAYLRGADLSESFLTGADLREAILVGTRLSDAILLEADLRGARMYGADLDGALLAYADLRGADLRGAFLVRADLSGANLSGADLHKAITDHTTIMP
ncbi:MAG: pentapeptide repeat-containing protein [Thaumarchaeota archaeon]|nr:pentapeptide repeat-containing protein [Nitrososphaerota archaeon]